MLRIALAFLIVALIAGLFSFLNGRDSGVFTFVGLEDRAMALRCSQAPFHVVAIGALVDKRPA